LVLLAGSPESPVWLRRKGREVQAGEVLDMLWTPEQLAEHEDAVAECAASASTPSISALAVADPLLPPAYPHSPRAQLSLAQLATDSRYHRAAVLAIGVCVFQQLSGINTVVYYSDAIFAACGLQSAALATVVVGFVNVVVTLVSAGAVDHYGRKMLWVGSHAGCAASLAVLAAAIAWKGVPAAPPSDFAASVEQSFIVIATDAISRV
jgi:Sugar (and other) transporter